MTADSTLVARRSAGVLLHPTSLPSGVLDDDVESWLGFISECGFSVWQVLPLGEPLDHVSPYQSISSFALNPALLSHHEEVDPDDTGFHRFCEEQSSWLDDYVLFKILKVKYGESLWCDWPVEYRDRNRDALSQLEIVEAGAMLSIRWQQFQLEQRWQQIHARANDMGIELFGDLPIFIGYDSADVWANRDQFLLDEDGRMEYVTGVPPDYFSETGQRWGNPHYDWDRMRDDGFYWWRNRLHRHLEMFDLLRIDHFRGLEAVWMIDAACESAIDGHWQTVPGDELLSRFMEEDAELPLVAEDLGVITPEVVALRKRFGLPGMSVLQFGFDAFEDNPHKPHNITEDSVVYTGTHDNDTTGGWFDSLDDEVKVFVLHTLGLLDPSSHDWRSCERARVRVVDTMMKIALDSTARLSIFPLQDLMYSGSEARMNVPGTVTGNWTWRFEWSQLYELSNCDKMKSLIESAGRIDDNRFDDNNG